MYMRPWDACTQTRLMRAGILCCYMHVNLNSNILPTCIQPVQNLSQCLFSLYFAVQNSPENYTLYSYSCKFYITAFAHVGIGLAPAVSDKILSSCIDKYVSQFDWATLHHTQCQNVLQPPYINM